LPSVRTIALGKEPRPGHRYRFFADCNGSGTRQRSTLCRVPYQALGKVPDMGTTLVNSLPSAVRQTLGKDVVSVTRRRNGCFSLPSAREQVLGKEGFCRCTVCRALFAECDTQQSLCRVFLRLCQVLQALGKVVGSGSVSYLFLIMLTLKYFSKKIRA
jgi:hypothetical protein